MTQRFRHIVSLFLVLTLGPLTSGHSFIQYLCAMNGNVIVCRMDACNDEGSAGPTISGPSCCVKHAVSPDLSKEYLKVELPTPSNQAVGYVIEVPTFDVPSSRSIVGRLFTDVSASSPPLYLSHLTLLI